jgi:hypothetical protein
MTFVNSARLEVLMAETASVISFIHSFIFNVFKQIQVQGEKQVHTPMDIEYVTS